MTEWNKEELDAQVQEIIEEAKGVGNAPTPPHTLDDLFAKQDALRLRFQNLKKYITTNISSAEYRSEAMVKLDDALATLIVGITKEMK